MTTTHVYILWSYCAVKVAVVAAVEGGDDMVVSWGDVLYVYVVLISTLLSCFLLTLRSIKSEIKAGFVMLLSSTTISPVSILTTEDMDGRSFGESWVQRRPIFRNLQACSASNSPFSDISTSPTNSFRSYRSHVCKNRR